MNITLDKNELDRFYKQIEEWSKDLESYISANFIKKYEECIGRARRKASNEPDLVFKFAYDVINTRLDEIDMIICGTVNFELIKEYKQLYPLPKLI